MHRAGKYGTQYPERLTALKETSQSSQYKFSLEMISWRGDWGDFSVINRVNTWKNIVALSAIIVMVLATALAEAKSN